MPFTAWKHTERNRQRDRKTYVMISGGFMIPAVQNNSLNHVFLIQDGQFVWSTGSAFTYTNWFSGSGFGTEPNHSGSSCLYMVGPNTGTGGTTNYEWFDGPCTISTDPLGTIQ